MQLMIKGWKIVLVQL